MSLRIENLGKSFGDFAALREVGLEAAHGALVALLGPSGSGKTTLLRILAGLERPDAGAVAFQSEDLLALPARERRVGMVFQHYALFRHMSVAENVAFGLRVRPRGRRPGRREIAGRVDTLLRLVQLEGHGARYPGQLSGGQRQRVALARALAIEPRLLLLDEPFGALDAKVRRELRRWLRRVHDETGVTTVFVTHDQEEALELADQVAILDAGRLVQAGPPQAVYERPASPFVFQFLGEANRLSGEVRGGRLEVAGWSTEAPPGAPQGRVGVWFRPHDVAVLEPEQPGVAATVRAISSAGPLARVRCVVGGEEVELHDLGSSLAGALSPGQTVKIRLLRPSAFPAETG